MLSGFTPNDVRELATPETLKVAGRLFGIGDPQAQALQQGRVPAWFWVVVGVAGGVYLGIQAQRRYPAKVQSAFDYVKGK